MKRRREMLRNLIFGVALILPLIAMGDENKTDTADQIDSASAEAGKLNVEAKKDKGSKDKGSKDKGSKKSTDHKNGDSPASSGSSKVRAAKKRVPAKKPAAADPQANDRQALVDTIHSYVAAYNKGDATAVAAHWSSNGVWVEQDSGDRITGSVALRDHFNEIFAAADRPRLNVMVDSIRFIAENVAVEDGTAQLVDTEGASESGYTAIHVKEKGNWKVDSVRENAISVTASPASASKYESLRELEWLVGEWTDASEESTIETNCKWTKNRNFLTQSFRVVVGGQVHMEGTQIIGWDPVNETIRSWVFDSDGGFGQGLWTRKGENRWVVKAAHNLADGSTASSVNMFRYISDGSYGWQSIGREVNGEFTPNIDEVIVTRSTAE
ncbi:MAG: hypothetical protein ACI9G1_002301 [Pirellulaceae bacterium]|jgi:uncharacterized protein (TIGR02246 family)